MKEEINMRVFKLNKSTKAFAESGLTNPDYVALLKLLEEDEMEEDKLIEKFSPTDLNNGGNPDKEYVKNLLSVLILKGFVSMSKK
jgi:DNA-binding MarR family transcriptional regulator